MSSVELFLLYGLAVWRLSHMLVAESGPFRVFDTVRWAGWRVGWGEGEYRRYALDFGCLWCTSVWVAILLLVLTPDRPTDPADFIVAVGALSALAIAIHGFTKLWSEVVTFVRKSSYRS